MPIKPENRHRYPADWPAVRLRILERAGYCCEHPGCGAHQYSVGWWSTTRRGHEWINEWPRGHWDARITYSDARAVAAGIFAAQGETGDKPIVIVLTIAHLDHNPENCADENLRALCQRHHLAHDHQHHLANSRATRMAKRNNLELPL